MLMCVCFCDKIALEHSATVTIRCDALGSLENVLSSHVICSAMTENKINDLEPPDVERVVCFVCVVADWRIAVCRSTRHARFITEPPVPVGFIQTVKMELTIALEALKKKR